MLLSISLVQWLSLMSLAGGVGWTLMEALKIESQCWPGPPPDGDRAQEETKVLVLTECHFPT